MAAFSQGSIVNQIQSITVGGITILDNTTLSWIKVLASGSILKFADLTTFKQGKEFVVTNNTFSNVVIKMVDDSILVVLPPAAERILRVLDNTNSVGGIEVDNSVDLAKPLYLTQAYPIPNSKLYIMSSSVERPDGTTASIGPVEHAFGNTLNTSIDFLTGAITGSTITLTGDTFVLPPANVGDFVRLVLSYVAASQTIDAAFSVGTSSYGLLTNPAILFLKTAGVPIGHVDLQCVNTSGQYKTAFSTFNVIENKVSNTSVITNYVGSGLGANHYPKNYVKNYEFEVGLTNWSQSGSIFINTTSIAGELLGKNRSLKITKNSDAPTSLDFVSASFFDINPVDLLEPLWISFDYKHLTNNAGYADFSIRIYDISNSNYIETQDSALPALQGNYRKMWMPAQNSSQYELRIFANVADRELVLDNFEVSRQPRLAGVGAEPFHSVVSGSLPTDQISITGCYILGSSFKAARKDDLIKIRGAVKIDSVSAGLTLAVDPQFARDLDKSIGDGTTTDNEVVGEVTAYHQGNSYKGSACFIGSSVNTIKFTDSLGDWSNTNPCAWVSGDYFVVSLEYPLNNADTVVEMANTKSEFTYNISLTNTDDTTSFMTGIGGSLVPNVLVTNKYKLIRFKTPFLSPEKIVIEVKPPDGSFWTDAATQFPHVSNYGMWLEAVTGSSTDVKVWFGSNGGIGGYTWATLNAQGWMWRVRRPSYIGVGEMMPASEFNAGYITTGEQTFAGHKTWRDSTGANKIAEWFDDTSAIFYGPVSFINPINNNQGIVPIGGIIPIAAHLAGSYNLPASGTISNEGWMRCDGATIPAGSLLGLTTPDLTSSRFILGTDGSASGVAPNNNPTSGTVGGANQFTTPNTTVSWISASASTTFTLPVWSGSGSFDRSDLNSNQDAHYHVSGAHTHDSTHSHSMQHAHQFAIWQYATSGYRIDAQANDSYDYTSVDIANPETIINNEAIGASGTVGNAFIIDQGSTGYLFTIDIASPCTITKVSHGLNNGTCITLTTNGSLPAPLNSNGIYYVVNALADTFQIASTSGGLAITTTGSQSGIHTFYINKKFYTAGVVGENGVGSSARTADETIVTSGPSGSTSTSTSSISFNGTQSVAISHSLTGGSVTFDKSVLNSDQNNHTHTISDSRPSFVAAVYLIRVR